MPTVPRETVLCRYRYDPLDRLVDCAPSAEAGIQRFYCKSRLATEIQGAVQRSVFQHEDQLLAQRRREDTKVDTALLATDQQRSVLNVLDANRLHPLAYSPYGHRPVANGLLSLLGFNGERPDPVTGHYLLGNGYRAFNPVLMRFNSPDSLSPFGEGGGNAYAYCEGDPRNRTDPSGHIWGIEKLLRRLFRATPKVLTNTPSSAPPLPPRKAPKLKPPRPITKPEPLPAKGFTIMDKHALISLPDDGDHVFFAPIPLDKESIIQLRRAGIHIHPDLLAPMEKSKINHGFVPDSDTVDSIRKT